MNSWKCGTIEMRVLMITSEWPTSERPHAVPFIVRQVENLRAADVEVDVFPFRGNKQIFNYLQARNEVRRLIHQRDFDVIHAQWGQSALLALPKTKPLVVTFRGDDVHGIVGKKNHQTLTGLVLTMISRYMAHIADERIVVARDLAFKLGINDYHVIPSGIDLEKFHPVEKRQARHILSLPEGELVLFAGDKSNPRKRFSLIEQAVNLAKNEIPNLDLVAADQVPHEIIPLYMSACDVLLLASVHEGSPNVVKEALACNLPVVSTDVGDVRERIDSIEGCVICDDDKPETLAAGILFVLSHKKRVDGRKTVIELDEIALTQKLISVYKKALGEV